MNAAGDLQLATLGLSRNNAAGYFRPLSLTCFAQLHVPWAERETAHSQREGALVKEPCGETMEGGRLWELLMVTNSTEDIVCKY